MKVKLMNKNPHLFVLEESFTVKYRKCECGGKIEMHITRQPNQPKIRGREYWVVEFCDKCDYWKQENRNI